ncbi:hypothetical protein MTR67_036750 [Solanum verrucosum]|uniref:Uncharacterized protein n=1 Tax=Solanum verrucosum TaxID=315347 RepID=A0AAF0UCP0_SOLVR|nr:hypothetical protein MTR67_036750 [Solanum verrucosum]
MVARPPAAAAEAAPVGDGGVGWRRSGMVAWRRSGMGGDGRRWGWVGVKQVLVKGPSGNLFLVQDSDGIRILQELLTEEFRVVHVFVVDDYEEIVLAPNIINHSETYHVQCEYGTDAESENDDGLVDPTSDVDKETTRAWTWFLQLFEKSLNMKNGDSITFMSYMQNGLLNAVENVLPLSNHRELESDLVLRPRIIFEELTRLKMRQNQQTRYANRVITFRGDHRGVSDSTNLLYLPTKVTWKGKEDMTSNQLNAREKKMGKLKTKKAN